MPTKINFRNKKRGDTRRLVFQVMDSDDKDASPVDVTGWTSLVMTIDPEESPVDAENNVASLVGFIVDGINGLVGFTPSGTVEPNDYFYDAQGVDDNGEIVTFVEGSIRITQDKSK